MGIWPTDLRKLRVLGGGSLIEFSKFSYNRFHISRLEYTTDALVVDIGERAFVEPSWIDSPTL